MVKLWRCEICGDPYIGESPPDNCPFCGAHKKHIVEANKAAASFEEDLGEGDRSNVEAALGLEVSNSAFYFCAAEKTDDPEGRLLFKALAKVEAEHAGIWKKLLRLKSLPEKKEACHTSNPDNLKESHERETHAIGFYRRAAAESENPRVRQIFEALVEVETDHLGLSERRL